MSGRDRQTIDRPRFRSAAALVLIAAALALSPVAADAAETPKSQWDREVAFGLTVKELVTAAAIGGWLGGSAALATRRASIGAGLGLLATIYVAHLAVEALVVGGVYFFWPGDEQGEEPGANQPGAVSPQRIAGLNLAIGSERASR